MAVREYNMGEGKGDQMFTQGDEITKEIKLILRAEVRCRIAKR